MIFQTLTLGISLQFSAPATKISIYTTILYIFILLPSLRSRTSHIRFGTLYDIYPNIYKLTFQLLQ